MVNRRDARLDKHIGKRVTIIFWNGNTKTGGIRLGKRV